MPEGLLLLPEYPLQHWHLPQRGYLQDPVTTLPKAVIGLALSVPSSAPDIDLLQKEATGEGEAWGQAGPLQALVGKVSAVCPPPNLDHTHLQLQAPPELEHLWPLCWFSHQHCPAGYWMAAGAAMGS